MRNLIKLFGIIALVAVIGFVVMACKDDDGGNPFVGTWKSADNTVTLVMTDTTWSLTVTSPVITDGGTYTYSGNTATGTGGHYDAIVTISGNKMNGTYGGEAIAELTKQ